MKRRNNLAALLGAALALTLALIPPSAFADADEDAPQRIHGMPADRAAVERLVGDSQGEAEVAAFGRTVSELKGRFPLAKDKPQPAAVLDFIGRNKDAFGLCDPAKELRLAGSDDYNDGDASLWFRQEYKGVPLFGKTLKAHINKDGELDRISADTAPTPDTDTTPVIDVAAAVNAAKSDCATASFKPWSSYGYPPEIVIYDNRLVYRVTLFLGAARWQFFVDAKNSGIITKAKVTGGAHYCDYR